MSNVSRFAPNAQALENIPHMLRYWADMVERDAEKGVEIELSALILVQKGDPRPAFFIAGTPHEAPHHPLFVAGVFDACRSAMLQVLDDET